MSEQATVNIPKDVLEPIVRAQVTAGIIKAFGDPAKLIEEVVAKAINVKVDSEGKVSQYQSYNTHTLLEVLSREMIHKIAKEMLAKYIEEQRPAIEKAMKATLAKSQGKFATALINGLLDATQNKYRFDCSLKIGD